MRLAAVEPALSPEPILAAFEGYRGSIIDLDQGQVFGRASLQRAVVELRARLREVGLQSGQRLVLSIGNGPGFFCSLAAVLAEGGAPLLVHFKTPPRELQRYANRFGASYILCDGCSQQELGEAKLPAPQRIESPVGSSLLLTVDTKHPEFDDRYPALSGVPLHPTSGTTGVPKIAVRPGPAAVAEADHYIETIGIDAGDSILVASPMSHAYAYGMGVMVPLRSGANVLSTRSFDASAVRHAISERRVTIWPAVPGMIDLLTFGAGDRLRGRMRCALSAGAPLPSRTARRFYDCTELQIRPLYGTTETGGISVGPDVDRLPDDGYVGPAMRGVETALRDELAQSSDGRTIGKLSIRSASMMAGYLGSQGIDTAQLSEGWFQTGDLAHLDDLSNMYLHGRQSEVINVGGLKVIPREVEEVIATLAGVQDVKVYAGEDRNGRQFVKAAIVVSDPLDSSRVQDHCARELVYYKRPHTVLFVKKLPRTPSGKVIVAELP